VTYTFIVEAGNDVTDGPNYHPFYITNSIDGGILLDTPEQRAVSGRTISLNLQNRTSNSISKMHVNYLCVQISKSSNKAIIIIFLVSRHRPHQFLGSRTNFQLFDYRSRE